MSNTGTAVKHIYSVLESNEHILEVDIIRYHNIAKQKKNISVTIEPILAVILDLHKSGKRIRDRQVANLLLQDKYNDMYMEDNKSMMPYNVYYKAENPDDYNPMYMYVQEFIRYSILKHYGFTIDEYLELSREYQEALIEVIKPSVEREEEEARKRTEELNKLNRGYDGRKF